MMKKEYSVAIKNREGETCVINRIYDTLAECEKAASASSYSVFIVEREVSEWKKV